MPIIETHDLSKAYGSIRAVDSISLSVERGEVFGFLGPNGAGKTTTIRTLLNLIRPTSGSAQIFGLDCARQSRRIRARLGNLPGDYSYDPALSGREMLALFAAIRGVDGLGRASQLAERFGADLDRRLGDLSRGNRQKLGLIQAAFHRPELLVLDEPTSGLDPLMQEEFLSFISEEREHGVTVFLSSHELDEVERACDRVAIIREGSLVAVEEVDALTERSFRRVVIEFASPVDATEFEGIAGVRRLTAEGCRVSFEAHGSIDEVIKAVAAHPVVGAEIKRPNLDEVVLRYYGAGGRR